MEIVKANLDRFEEGYAVLYCDDGRKFDVSIRRIPKHIKEGSRVAIHIDEGKIIDIFYEEVETEDLEKQNKEKLERLKHGKHLK